MKTIVQLGLRLKSSIIGTPLEATAMRVRWAANIGQRMRHPELWGIYSEELWLPRILKRLLTRSSCVADVGCHIGSFLSLALKYAPEGQHIAFEPSPLRSSMVKRRFPNVEVLTVAVGEANGTASFAEDLQRPGYSHIKRNTVANSATYIVNVCRLDDILLQRPRLDLIKLDIEGGELSALRGAKEVISKWRPPILFECGSEYSAHETGLDRKALFDLLTESGYAIATYVYFAFEKGKMGFDEFYRCGLYPFRAFNFVAYTAESHSSG
jgi:FkbM family methyltransferase